MAENSPQIRYSDTQIDEGLQLVANCNGSATKAARELELVGRPIPRDTLQRWKTSHPERYAEARKLASEQVWGRISDEYRSSAERAAVVMQEAIAKSREAMQAGESMEAKRLSDIARNLSVTGGVSVDKAGGIEGRPTQAPAHTPNLPELIRRVQDKFGHVFVDAEVIEADKELSKGNAQDEENDE